MRLVYTVSSTLYDDDGTVRNTSIAMTKEVKKSYQTCPQCDAIYWEQNYSECPACRAAMAYMDTEEGPENG